MKNYFDFTLSGKKLLPIWILFYIVIIVPYAVLLKSISGMENLEQSNPYIGLLFIPIIILAYVIMFYIFKMAIENVRYRDNAIEFKGKASTYIGKVLLGFLLTIVTLSIYLAWFIKDITKFFVNNSSLNNENLSFKGKGGKLFLIILLAVIVPMVIVSLLMSKVFADYATNKLFMAAYQAVVVLIMIPYMYLIYKWMVNVDYKKYHIEWQTSFGSSALMILGQILLTIITAGIYLPLAYLKLFKYFSERTIATSDEKVLKFGYELERGKDFLFIWGQLLLTAITAGIYYPWAFAKVGKRILAKTYVIPV